VSQKNAPFVACHNFDIHELILMTFGRCYGDNMQTQLLHI